MSIHWLSRAAAKEERVYRRSFERLPGLSLLGRQRISAGLSQITL